MPDHDLPDDLIQLKRAWYAADVRRTELAAAEPAPTAIAALEADLSDEQRQAWADAHAELLRLTEALHAHPYWAATDDPMGGQAALRKAARA